MWATLLLPLNADDSIDFTRLESQAEVLGGSQLDGLYAHGTAGEFQTLTEDEPCILARSRWSSRTGFR